jgi:hypothetical protein
MAESNNPEPKVSTPTVSFNDVVRDVARRNEEGQKVARAKRAVREKEQRATRRLWEQL